MAHRRKVKPYFSPDRYSIESRASVTNYADDSMPQLLPTPERSRIARPVLRVVTARKALGRPELFVLTSIGEK
jgi:hypothetical protein